MHSHARVLGRVGSLSYVPPSLLESREHSTRPLSIAVHGVVCSMTRDKAHPASTSYSNRMHRGGHRSKRNRLASQSWLTNFSGVQDVRELGVALADRIAHTALGRSYRFALVMIFNVRHINTSLLKTSSLRLKTSSLRLL